jgi:hypothetical protein
MVTRTGLSRAASHLVPIAVIAIGAAKAWDGLWSSIGTPEGFFGGDLAAYVAAANRLAASGSPYSEELLAGRIGRDNIEIGYYYAPPLAQAFVPFRGFDPTTLALGWTLAQAIILGCLLVALSTVARGRFDRSAALAAIALGVASFPFEFAIFGGNVSGWIAAMVAVMLLGGTRIAGGAAAFAAIVKVTAAPLMVAGLFAAGSRRTVVVTVLALVGVSLALSPAAWADWLAVLPNVGPPEPEGIALGAILRGTPFAGLALAAGFIISIAFALAAIRRARRFGLDVRVVACALGSYVFASPALWEHYLAALVPLMVVAWPNASQWQRAAIIAGAVTQILPWYLPPVPVVSGAELAGALMVLLAAAYSGTNPRREALFATVRTPAWANVVEPALPGPQETPRSSLPTP